MSASFQLAKLEKQQEAMINLLQSSLNIICSLLHILHWCEGEAALHKDNFNPWYLAWIYTKYDVLVVIAYNRYNQYMCECLDYFQTIKGFWVRVEKSQRKWKLESCAEAYMKMRKRQKKKDKIKNKKIVESKSVAIGHRPTKSRKCSKNWLQRKIERENNSQELKEYLREEVMQVKKGNAAHYATRGASIDAIAVKHWKIAKVLIKYSCGRKSWKCIEHPHVQAMKDVFNWWQKEWKNKNSLYKIRVDNCFVVYCNVHGKNIPCI